MKKRWMLTMLAIIIVLSMDITAYAYELEEKITYNLEKQVTLEEAFIKLEKIANNEIIFYFADDINLQKGFRILAGRDTYKNVLDLILQFNNLQRIRLAKQLFYIYPQSKQAKYEAKRNTIVKSKTMNDKVDWDNYIEKPVLTNVTLKSKTKFRIGINKIIQTETKRDYSPEAKMAINGEYVLADNYSLYLNSRLSSAPLMIEVGSRYYTAAYKGAFADLSLINRTENEIRKYIDLTIGGGYLLELNDSLLGDFKLGYTITPNQQDNYASLSLGVKFSLPSITNKSNKENAKKINQNTEELRIKYPSWQEKTIKMIKQEKIALNLNTTQVLESWGLAEEIQIKEKGKYQKWIYKFKNELEETDKKYILYFVDRKLKKLRTD